MSANQRKGQFTSSCVQLWNSCCKMHFHFYGYGRFHFLDGYRICDEYWKWDIFILNHFWNILEVCFTGHSLPDTRFLFSAWSFTYQQANVCQMFPGTLPLWALQPRTIHHYVGFLNNNIDLLAPQRIPFNFTWSHENKHIYEVQILGTTKVTLEQRRPILKFYIIFSVIWILYSLSDLETDSSWRIFSPTLSSCPEVFLTIDNRIWRESSSSSPVASYLFALQPGYLLAFFLANVF